MRERFAAEIRDPIHGYILTSELEERLIDTETVQRMRRIRQLAGCHLVYPGGQHSRFEHMIGAMYLAGRVGGVLESSKKNHTFTAEDTVKLRLAALLHDVGHGPFSHMFEEVMADRSKFTHEDMTRSIIMESEVGETLESYGISKREMSQLAVAKAGSPAVHNDGSRREFMNDAISGALSVDTMDYLPRDSYFTGVEYGKVDVHRIINSFEVSSDDRLAIGQAALFAFEALMIARYEMFRAVYFHRTVRAAELMLIKSMILADKELNLTDTSLENYLAMTDDATLYRIRSMKTDSDHDLRRAKQLADDYFRRRLVKCVFERVFQRSGRLRYSVFTDKRFRSLLVEEIARSSGVDTDDIFVDVPTTPSVPISSDRASFRSITIVRAGAHAQEPTKRSYELFLRDMPLLRAIEGHMDVMRVYTTERNRYRVEGAVKRVLRREEFGSKIEDEI